MPAATSLHPLFAVRIDGIDIDHPADADWIREALDRWSVLVFPPQAITGESQVAFSEMVGTLETTRAGANGAGGKLIVLTNIEPDGQTAPPTGEQVLNNRANQSCHQDSSFKAVPARVPILSAREIPSSGGDTAFCSMRATRAALPEALNAAARVRVAVLDFGWSRAVMHRAAPFASNKEHRHMVRTTVSCPLSVC